jgi:hypothetical protein
MSRSRAEASSSVSTQVVHPPRGLSVSSIPIHIRVGLVPYVTERISFV